MKMSNQIVFLLLSLTAGAMIPFQSAMNAQLGKSLQSPYYSALTVFIVAAVGLVIYILLARYNVPAVSQFAAAPNGAT